ncbi:CBS domain-containing protein [Amorphus orientalis]|uniref:CBS domain-containing protein n=1 Tax=Amorphus orientalis TaxID=649198 RepID=A0AAE3VTZ0_9HYPH|nr:CBS domain-containing protein [Amorphus orientalis]MDQ0317800.1 CBS domain-containing protein [Amorphus orientalis]
MRISEIMSRDTVIADPNETIEAVARRMADQDIGYLPVGEQDRLVGSITDRDIVTRGLANGRDGSCTVDEIMTRDVKYCFDEDDVEQIAGNMANNGVRRLPVINRDKRLVGVVSLSDAAQHGAAEGAGRGLGKLGAQPGTA